MNQERLDLYSDYLCATFGKATATGLAALLDDDANVWNRFPAAMWNEVPKSAPLTRSLNQTHVQTLPWGAETLPKPSSQPAAEGHDHGAMNQG